MTAPRFTPREVLTSDKLNLLSDAVDAVVVPTTVDLRLPGSTAADGTLGVSDGGGGENEGAVFLTSAQTDFRGTDDTMQFRIGSGPDATSFWMAVGGASTNQPAVLVASSDTNTDVDGMLVTQGRGSIWLAGGSGIYLQIKDQGTGNVAANYLSIAPGDSNADPTIGSTRGANYDTTGTTNQHAFKIAGATHLVVRAPLAPATTDRWWEFSSDGTSGFARLEATGTATNVSAFMRAKGSGGINLWNGQGGMLNVLPIDGSTTANNFLMRPSATGVAPLLQSAGEATAGLTVRQGGTGALTLGNATGTSAYDGTQHSFKIAGQIHFQVRSASPPATTDRYWEISSEGTSGAAKLETAGTATNVPGFIRAKGSSGLDLWNGQGAMLGLIPIDNNATANALRMRPAPAGVAPIIESTGEATAGLTVRQGGTGVLTLGSGTGVLTLGGPTGSSVFDGTEHSFKVGGAIMAKVRSPLAPVSSDRWWEFSSDGTTGFCRFEAAGTATDVAGFIRAKGNGSLDFWNGQGSMLTLAPIVTGTASANGLRMRPAVAGVAPIIEPGGETNAGLVVRAAGTGTLAVGQSTGTTQLTGKVTHAGTQTVTPADAGSVTISDTTRFLYLIGPGTVTGYTLTFPAAPANSQVFTVSTNVTINTVTCSSAATIDGAVTSLGPTTPVSWSWVAANSRWMRV